MKADIEVVVFGQIIDSIYGIDRQIKSCATTLAQELDKG
jgi:hypothetical protein